MSSRDIGRRRVLSKEERVLWSSVTRSMKPLREGAADADEDQIEKPIRPQVERPSARSQANRRADASPALTPLDRRMRSRIARGRKAIDARLDLHGMTQSEAYAALLHFLRQASATGAQLVLVITGKGARGAHGERGILRRQVPHWLALSEFRPFVIGFEDAHIAHGGEGALYVRVRRARGV